MTKLNFQHHYFIITSEIIVICWFCGQETYFLSTIFIKAVLYVDFFLFSFNKSSKSTKNVEKVVGMVMNFHFTELCSH